MKIEQIDDQRVVIELESLQETVALWAVAGRVGGGSGSLRELFSTKGEKPSGGIYEALTPIVSAQVSARDSRAFRHRPMTIRNILESLCQSRVSGRIDITPFHQKKDTGHVIED